MDAPTTLRSAAPADWPRIAALLQASGLPLDGAEEMVGDFVLAEQAGGLVGCAGLERHGDAALLRSVAARPEARGQGVGRRVVEAALGRARAGGMRRVVLLTETAAGYFPRFGFRAAPRTEAPEAVRDSVEFTSACPDTALMMILDL